MRHIALGLLLVLAASPARADDDPDDEDSYFAAFPRHTLAAGFVGHSTRIDGHSEGGMGAELELGYGRGRWQYTADASLENSTLHETEMTAVAGRRTHGALGMRWLARQFIPFDRLAVDMYMHAAGGLASYHWMDGHSTRPDLEVGVGFGMRRLARQDVFVRVDLDLLFSRGDSGFTGGLVVGW